MSLIGLEGKESNEGEEGGDMICITAHYTAQEKTFAYLTN